MANFLACYLNFFKNDFLLDPDPHTECGSGSKALLLSLSPLV